MPSFLYISRYVDIFEGALRMIASLFFTCENVHWEIYYYPQMIFLEDNMYSMQRSPFRGDISAGDLLSIIYGQTQNTLRNVH
jgi:hypothetical protein